MLNRTAFGRHVYATGDDPDAARLSGINTDRTLIAVYALAGLICAFAAWVLIGRIGGVSPQAGLTANLNSITAVVIGGTSLFGGRGSIIGTLFGALIVGVFRNGLALSGLDVLWQDFTVGVLIIVAVTIDQWIKADLGMTAPVLEARGLTKRYGRVVALDHADFTLMPGEILGVIGDNGAGKSTLIKALCGAVIPDAGEILLGGEPVHFRSPIDARRAGIETVYQNLALSPALSIADNLFLGREVRKPGIAGSVFRRLDRSYMARVARERLTELGLMTIQNIHQSVETLSGGQRQGVAVARAAAFGVAGGDHGRADRGARGQGEPPGAGSDPGGARARHADGPDQPQHAARLRGRRPHPYPPAGPAALRGRTPRTTRCRTPSPS